jgi:RimJ/RimL family protein N-acetyltransferase
VTIPREGTTPIGALGAVFSVHGAEIGYVLGRDWWGQRLMVEAVASVMDWLQRQAGIYRIWAYCEANHLRSVRVLERSGMTYEGTLKRWIVLPNLADEPCDAKVFAWTRP